MEESVKDLVDLRRRLHTLAEPSHGESATADALIDFLAGMKAGPLTTRLGGFGLAATVHGRDPGPRVLIRSDMDALPIEDRIDGRHVSKTSGVGHKCGHDGHMAILCGLARRLAKNPPERGEAVLLFQPAEETGEGAALVLEDSAFAPLRPDSAFALHNLPGFPLGSVIARTGCFASASRGMVIGLRGESAHAAEPHLARSPALAVSGLIAAISSLPQTALALNRPAKATVIHARLGSEAFGTTPGDAEVMATLRTYSDSAMRTLAEAAERLARSAGEPDRLKVSVDWKQDFPATTNSASAVRTVRSCAEALGLAVLEPDAPFPWSEDFGHFTGRFGGALFGLGAGEDHPPLHNSGYDFPDTLLPIGVDLLESVVRRSLAED